MEMKETNGKKLLEDEIVIDKVDSSKSDQKDAEPVNTINKSTFSQIAHSLSPEPEKLLS